jgi:hypothetical protein
VKVSGYKNVHTKVGEIARTFKRPDYSNDPYKKFKLLVFLSPNRLLRLHRPSVFSICSCNCISRKMSSPIPSLGQAMRRFTRLSLRQSETKSSSRLAAPSSRFGFSQFSRLSTRSRKHSLSSQCIHSRCFSSSAFRRASKVPNRNPFTRSGVRIFLRGN